jgi:hypothetical protein
MVWRVTYRPERPFTTAERAEQLGGMDCPVPPSGYLPPTPEAGSRWIPRLNRSNDYGLDREVERTSMYSGVPGVWAQDRACTEGMGAIMDRSTERLASSDAPVIQMRRMLIRAARELERSDTPPPGATESPAVSAIPTALLARDMTWEAVADRIDSDLRREREPSGEGSLGSGVRKPAPGEA